MFEQVRGAFNKLITLLENPKTSSDLKEKGPITASSGNHALACLHAMKTLGLKGRFHSKCNFVFTMNVD